jgi:hypothetical protein
MGRRTEKAAENITTAIYLAGRTVAGEIGARVANAVTSTITGATIQPCSGDCDVARRGGTCPGNH